MNVAIFSARDRDSRSGNWVTASRWRRLLQTAGHRASILHHASDVDNCGADILIGLHARRSSKAILRFKRLHPNCKTMITLTGTDLYRDFAPTRSRHPALAVRALDQSNRIILLQPLMAQRLKLQWKKKSSLVMMDVPKSKQPPRTKASVPLRVCVIGHMRHEKDSLRTAMAVRDIPTGIVEVTHAGKALSELLQQRAKRESTKNANWSWLGSVTHEKVQQLMKSSDVLVNSSRIEGAPNVLFEAIRWRLPVIASRIDGHVGVLGNRYKGFFQTGVTQDLHRLLLRCSQHSKFYGELGKSIDRLATKYRQGSEFKSLTSAISKL